MSRWLVVVSVGLGLGWMGEQEGGPGSAEPRVQEAIELMAVAHQALYVGMEQMIPGKRVGDISHAVQSFVESRGFSVVR